MLDESRSSGLGQPLRGLRGLARTERAERGRWDLNRGTGETVEIT